jgi:hypothetical protein
MTIKPDAAAKMVMVSFVACADRAAPRVNIASPICVAAFPRSWV